MSNFLGSLQFQIVGIVLFLIAAVKFSIIGFYPSEALPYFLILLAAVACLIISTKIKPVSPGEDNSGLGIPGKWKYACGQFNNNQESMCAKCGNKRPS